MYKSKLVYEQQCATCKVVSGLFFTGLTMFHVMRISNIWRHYRTYEKVFNASMVFLLSGISFLNYYAAYEIHEGKNMRSANIQMRPSFTQRFSDAYHFHTLNPQEKLAYL